jgi:hypothetical protein
MDRNVEKAYALAGQPSNQSSMPAPTVSPTKSRPAGINGSGYSDLLTRLNQIQGQMESGKIFNPSSVALGQRRTAGAILDFLLDVHDLDPVQAVPYFTRGVRSESKLDIPTVFDPALFLNKPFTTQYIEKMNFTLAPQGTGTIAEMLYVSADSRPIALGVFVRAKVINKLVQASFRIRHEITGLFPGSIYEQEFYLVNDIACGFFPFLNSSVNVDTIVTPAVPPSITFTTQQGANFVLGGFRSPIFDQVSGVIEQDLTAAQNGLFSLVSASNADIEVCLVPNFGNAGLSLSRSILEGNEASFFNAINAELL